MKMDNLSVKSKSVVPTLPSFKVSPPHSLSFSALKKWMKAQQKKKQMEEKKKVIAQKKAAAPKKNRLVADDEPVDPRVSNNHFTRN